MQPLQQTPVPCLLKLFTKSTNLNKFIPLTEWRQKWHSVDIFALRHVVQWELQGAVLSQYLLTFWLSLTNADSEAINDDEQYSIIPVA